MSRNTEDISDKDSYGYQRKSSEEVDDIVKRLSTPKKPKETKKPDRRRKIERQMTAEEIDVMVNRLTSAGRLTERPPSAYEQKGVCGSYEFNGVCTGVKFY